MKTKKGKQSGFSLIELMIAMAVVLVLVAALVISGGRALRASNETTAAQNVSTLAADEATFQHAWQGYSPLAVNLAGSELQQTTAATFLADQEVTTTEANALDAGYTTSGYTVKYAPGTTTFTDNAGNPVVTAFEVTAIPLSSSSGTKAFCSDISGTFWIDTGAKAATGAGCKTDGYTNSM